MCVHIYSVTTLYSKPKVLLTMAETTEYVDKFVARIICVLCQKGKQLIITNKRNTVHGRPSL